MRRANAHAGRLVVLKPRPWRRVQLREEQTVVARHPDVVAFGRLAKDTIVAAFDRFRLGIDEGAAIANLADGAVAPRATAGPEEDALADRERRSGGFELDMRVPLGRQ